MEIYKAKIVVLDKNEVQKIREYSRRIKDLKESEIPTEVKTAIMVLLIEIDKSNEPIHRTIKVLDSTSWFNILNRYFQNNENVIQDEFMQNFINSITSWSFIQ